MSVRQSETCPCCSAVLRVAWNRRSFLAAAGGSALGLSFSRFACAEDIPTIGYESVPDLLHLPSDLYLGEVSGVALNSKGHIFVLHRGDTSGPAYGAAAAQLLEFDADGNYLREIGHHLYAWSFAHTVKVDVQDYVWVTDKGSDMVIKFTPEGRVDMVFGRKQEASDEGTAPLKHPNPPLPAQDGYFRQVTDVAWDDVGNSYISDGYINSRVAKVDKDGNWLKSWGDRGTGPGQFHTPHSIAVDAAGKVYVADRSNRRIQVFDGEGGFLRQFTIDAPVPPDARPAIGNMPDEVDVGRRHIRARCALGDLPFAAAEPISVRRRWLSGPRLQTDARGQITGNVRPIRQKIEAIRLDSPNDLPGGQRAVCRRASELARSKASAPGLEHDAVRDQRSAPGSNWTSSTALSRGRPACSALSGVRSGRGVDRSALVLAGGRPTRWTPGSPSQRRKEQTRHNVGKGRRRAARLSGWLPSCEAAAVRRLRAVLRRWGILQVQT